MKLHFLFLFLLLFSSQSYATSSSNLQGVNIGSANDWSRGFIFADMVKVARPWGSPNTPWDVIGPVDQNGWPTRDAGIVLATNGVSLGGNYQLSFDGQAVIAPISSPNVLIQNIIYDSSTNKTSAVVNVPANAIQLMLKFTTTRRLPSDTTNTGITNLKIIRPGHTENETFYRPFLEQLAFSKTLRMMDFLSTNTNNDTSWSDRTLPSYAIQASTRPNHGVSYEYAIKLANQLNKDLWINIPDQATDDYVLRLAQLFKFGAGANGMPYTSPVANPVWAPLNPNLKLYVEYSNEVWNSSFKQFSRQYKRANAPTWVMGNHYAAGDYVISNGKLFQCTSAITSSATAPTEQDTFDIADGDGKWVYAFPYPSKLNYDNANNPYYLQWRLTGERTKRISDIFNTVSYPAGTPSSMKLNVLPVLATQLAYSEVYRQALLYLDYAYNKTGTPPKKMSSYIYGLAGAPYFASASLNAGAYAVTPAYTAGTYVISNGNLYQANSAITENWQAAKAYAIGKIVVSNGNLYKCAVAISSSSSSPQGLGTGIVDGSGSWSFLSQAQNRMAPNGTDAVVSDGDGSWKYIYQVGDTTATIDTAFTDMSLAMDKITTGTQSIYASLVGHAKFYGLAPMAYEGGYDTAVITANNVPVAVSDAFQLDTRFQTLTKRVFDDWFSSGGEVFNFYSLVSPYDKYGTWGLSQELGNFSTPKWLGYKDAFNEAQLPPLTIGNAIPGNISFSQALGKWGTYTSGSAVYLPGTAYVMYLINCPEDRDYTVTTNILNTEATFEFDTGNVYQVTAGTNKSFTQYLKKGLHVLKIRNDKPGTVGVDILKFTAN